ncbi:MAG: phosphodiester glycosidase family protein [Candidatus Daviesbacteria bacterium]
MTTEKGITHLLLIIIVSLVLGALVVAKNSSSIPVFQTSSPSAVPSQNQTDMEQSPTFIPTLTPALIPTQIAPPTSTPKPPAQTGPPGAGLTSKTVATEKGNFSVTILMVDLNGAKMMTDTASDSECSNDCPTLSLKDFVQRNGGFAGVNGSYFCPDSYSECSGKKNAFDFPVYNSRLGKWINQGNLFWNSRAMVYFDGSGIHYKQSANEFSGGASAGIVNYPGILNEGNVQIDDNQSGLSDKQKAKGTKVGIGVSGDKNVMVVIAQNVNMQEFGYVFKALGAKGAMNLDTGGSTALFYNGSYVFGPGRGLGNAIIFTR